MSKLKRSESIKRVSKGDYQLLRIDSAYKKSGTISDFTFSPNNDVTFKSARLMSIEFPNTIYPISSSRSTAYLRVNQNGLIIDVYLTEGNYSNADFIVMLQDQLNAAAGSNGSYSVTYDKNSAKITIANIVLIELQLTYSGDLYKVLGFDNADTGLLLSHTSTSVVNLSGPNYLTFNINPLPTGSKILSGNGTTGLYTFPLVVPFGAINFFEADGLGYDLIVSNGVKNNMRNIRITLYDEQGRIPELFLDWSMLLRLE